MAHIPGQFVPLDIHYLRDPRIRRAGPNAELLYIRSLVHAKGADTDGFVADFDLGIVAVGMRDSAHRVAALVREGLWIEVDGGWRIRSWAKWNKTKAQVRAEKEVQRDAAIKGNHERWHVGSGKSDPRCPHCLPDQVGDRGGDRVSVAEVEVEPEREPEGEVEVETTLSSEVADATPRPEIDALLDLLDLRIRQNGARVPGRTKKNRDAARLLIDRDGHTPEQVRAAIEWCQADEFWRSNILSMMKLREKYDQLRLAAMRNPRPGGKRTTDDKVLDGLALAARLRENAATEQKQIGD